MRIKKLNEFENLNEAQNWPTGSIAKVSTKNALGQYNYSWGTFYPDQVPGAEGGVFYMKVDQSGRKWMEGPILAGNCLLNADFSKVRADKAVLQNPGPEYTYFEKDKIFDKKIMGNSYYVEGNEASLMDMEGKKHVVTEGEFTAKSLNFKLTVEMKETVVYLRSKSRKSEYFNAKLSDLTNMSQELSLDQKKAIAEWFSTQLGGAEIEVSRDNFAITQWFIEAPTRGGYPNSFKAGPFVNEKQAETVMEGINKLNKYSLFDPTEANVSSSWQKTNMTLDNLIDWAKQVGVKTTMKELLALRKGAVAAQRFGV
jgi:hypothetical protein